MKTFNNMKIVELNSLDKNGSYSFCDINDFSALVEIAGHISVPVHIEEALNSFIDDVSDYLYDKMSGVLLSEEDGAFLSNAISDEIEELTRQDIFSKYVKEYTNEIYVGLMPQDVRGFYYLEDHSPDYTDVYKEIFDLYKNEILERVIIIKEEAHTAAEEKAQLERDKQLAIEKAREEFNSCTTDTGKKKVVAALKAELESKYGMKVTKDQIQYVLFIDSKLNILSKD